MNGNQKFSTVYKEIKKTSDKDDSNKAAQLIVEDDYKVHFPIYDIIKGKKERAGE